jgi:hypothetical protein
LALAGVGALSIGAGPVFAASDVFNLTGAVSDFQSQSYPGGNGQQYDDDYLQLSGVNPTIVTENDTVTVNVSLDQVYTIPASQTYTNILLYLQGSGFDGTPVGNAGTFTFYDGGQVVGTYDSSAGTSGQIASYAVLPANQPLTFDSLSDNLVVTALDQPVTITGAAFDYQLVSPVSATPEPSAWLLMFVGVGAVGLALRRTKRAVKGRSRDVVTA